MSQNRVKGPASPFEAAPPSSGSAPSAVSALASRFDAPPPATSSDPHVSDKVSNLASRFGATIADAPAASLTRKPAPGSKVPVQPEPPAPVVEERPNFGEITKRFASGARSDDPNAEDPPNMFAAAASAWGKREEEARPVAEGKVSAFKREIETAKKTDAPPVRMEDLVDERRDKVVEEASMGVGSIASRFESGPKKDAQKDSVEQLPNRFESATKLFAGEEKKPVPEEEADADSVKSRFADAARLFGGGVGK